MVIVITGTPGVGKEKLAKYLAKKLGVDRLNLYDHYNEISVGYDKKKKCYTVDVKKFEKLIRGKVKENKELIIDSHISHLLPKRLVDLCVVLTCSNLKKLDKILKKRKYSKAKIRENLDSEIFQVCLIEAKERKHKIIEVDGCKNINKKQLLNKITKSL